jgi:hypothetical protein
MGTVLVFGWWFYLNAVAIGPFETGTDCQEVSARVHGSDCWKGTLPR